MSFSAKVLRWFHSHGRKDLPWQQDKTPYRVWVSEIMLQQTQVGTVIPYFERWMQRFPDVRSLAAAETDQVLHLWAGLGYYARARNLHKAARIISEKYAGEFPDTVDELEKLPGIGRSTAGAIAALVMNQRAAILDGNVKRVLTRCFAIEGYPEQSTIKKQLWQLAEELLPANNIADYTQAMMDLGSEVCKRSNPACEQCPLNADCQALKLNLIAKIPGKKPKKVMPVKAVQMLIVQNRAGEVLLQKRPPAGIWGGLYSFPEQQIDDNVGEPQSSNWQLSASSWLKADSPLPLDPVRHTFTHYHLDIQPLYTREFEIKDEVAESAGWLWYPLDNSIEVGLAAPVKKLLGQLSEETR